MKVLSKKKLLKQYGFPRGYLTLGGLPAVLSQAHLCLAALPAGAAGRKLPGELGAA